MFPSISVRATKMYKLTTSSGKEFLMPDAELIRKVILELPVGDDSFAILEKGYDGVHFVQTAGSAAEGFILEYQDGGPQLHYQCDEGNLDSQQVIAVFQAYARADPRWNAAHTWIQVDFS